MNRSTNSDSKSFLVLSLPVLVASLFAASRLFMGGPQVIPRDAPPNANSAASALSASRVTSASPGLITPTPAEARKLFALASTISKAANSCPVRAEIRWWASFETRSYCGEITAARHAGAFWRLLYRAI